MSTFSSIRLMTIYYLQDNGTFFVFSSEFTAAEKKQNADELRQ